MARGNATQLITPSTSPASGPEVHPSENKDVATDDDDEPVLPLGTSQAATAKAKRRLNLHSSSYAGQPPAKKKKRIAQPARQTAAVQTTLSLTIGGGAGMRECRVCDTVYNPFHPEDAKVHAKRHAVVLRNGAAE